MFSHSIYCFTCSFPFGFISVLLVFMCVCVRKNNTVFHLKGKRPVFFILFCFFVSCFFFSYLYSLYAMIESLVGDDGADEMRMQGRVTQDRKCHQPHMGMSVKATLASEEIELAITAVVP